jgi:hypothetical protein
VALTVGFADEHDLAAFVALADVDLSFQQEKHPVIGGLFIAFFVDDEVADIEGYGLHHAGQVHERHRLAFELFEQAKLKNLIGWNRHG